MPNPSDMFWDGITRAEETFRVRRAAHDERYGEEYAYRLANAYMQHPWVNPQLLVSLVLNDADDLLPQVSEYALRRMASVGASPYDIATRDQADQKIQKYLLAKEMEQDPEGDSLLREYGKTLRTEQT
jgi:hypothetical protein